MRQGQQHNNHKNRMRGRNNNNNNNRKGPNPLTRSYESNGGDVKIRGTALHVAEKYVQLARDAQSSGDRVAAENYLQHAEHYYRIVAAAQAQMPQPQPVFRSDEEGDDEEGGEMRNGAPQNAGQGGGQYGNNPYGNQNPYGGNRQHGGGQQYGGNNPYGGGEQPHMNGNGNGASYGNAPQARAEQPTEDQQPQPVEQRPQGEFRAVADENADRAQQGGGEFRGPNPGGRRRRRPYRENYGDRGAGEGAPAPQAEAVAEQGGGEE